MHRFIEAKDFIQVLIEIGSGHHYDSEFDRNVVMQIVHEKDFYILASELKSDELATLIKGLCKFEGFPDMQFGSTTRIPKLLDLTRKSHNIAYTELVDWLFANRTNPYIPYGGDIPLNVKSEAEYREYEVKRTVHRNKMEELSQRKHIEAEAQHKKIRERHEDIHEQKQKIYQEIRGRFLNMSDKELIDAFNREVDNNGLTSTRAIYLSALHEEFERRHYNYSVIGNDKRLSFKKRIRIKDKNIYIEKWHDRAMEWLKQNWKWEISLVLILGTLFFVREWDGGRSNNTAQISDIISSSPTITIDSKDGVSHSFVDFMPSDISNDPQSPLVVQSYSGYSLKFKKGDMEVPNAEDAWRYLEVLKNNISVLRIDSKEVEPWGYKFVESHRYDFDGNSYFVIKDWCGGATCGGELIPLVMGKDGLKHGNSVHWPIYDDSMGYSIANGELYIYFYNEQGVQSGEPIIFRFDKTSGNLDEQKVSGVP